MKKRICIIMAMLLLTGGLLAGCSSPANSTPSGTNGFYAPDQVKKGGSPSGTGNINIKEITSSKQGDDTVLEIKLLYGSRKQGKDEAQINNNPEYEVSCLDTPNRLVLKLKDIVYYDFDKTKVPNGIIQNVFFKTWIKDSSSDFFEVYFNLSQQASYKVEEEKGKIKITLHPTNATKEKGYFVTINAFNELNEGGFPEDSGFTPTICSDGNSKLLISRQFKNREEAEKFKNDTQNKLAQYLEGKIIRTVELPAGELPEYSNTIDSAELAKIPAVKINDKEYPLNILLNDGVYRCTAPDGTILFSRAFQTEETAQPSDEASEEPGEEPENPIFQKLWTLDRQGAAKPLDNLAEFSYIRKAAYSPSGKYLAVLDSGLSNVTLYVYDITSKETYNMGEEGLGDTDDFVWDTAKDLLYSISGTEEDKQLMVNDFSQNTHTPQALEEQGIKSGFIGIGSGKLYFEDDDKKQIFEFDTAAKTRKKIADGTGFILSPDGKYMTYFKPQVKAPAVSASNEQADMAADEAADEQQDLELLDFMLLDLAAGTEKMLVKEADIPIEACAFSADNKSIFYINQNDVQNENEESFDTVYPNLLSQYDIASGNVKVLLKTAIEGFSVTKDNKIYLQKTLDYGENGLDVTYIYDPAANYTAK